MALIAPEAIREAFVKVNIILEEVHQAFASNYNNALPLLHTTHLVQTIRDMRRTADIVKHDSENYLFLRKIESDPCEIYQYHVSLNKWEQLGLCPHYRCSTAYHNNLMTIGGAVTRDDGAQRTAEIHSFVGENWMRLHPDMPTPRSRSLALTCMFMNAKLLIVIGGESDAETSLKKVEILDMTNPNAAWTTANDLPETVCSSSGTVAGDYIYVLGGWSKRNNPSSAVFRCSIAALVESTRSNAVNVWEKLPDLPVEEATCTTFHNTLIVVGGRANSVAVHDIRTYNSTSKRWEVIGYLQHPRYICFAIGLSEKLVVIGGKKDTQAKENTIEILQKCIQ